MAGFDLANATYVLSFGSGLIEGWGSPPLHAPGPRAPCRTNGGQLSQSSRACPRPPPRPTSGFPIQPGHGRRPGAGSGPCDPQGRALPEGLCRGPMRPGWTPSGSSPARPTPRRRSPSRPASTPRPSSIWPGPSPAPRSRSRSAVAARVGSRGASRSIWPSTYLNALVGSINTPGGVIAVPEPEYISWPEPEMDAVGIKGMQQPRVDGAGAAPLPAVALPAQPPAQGARHRDTPGKGPLRSQRQPGSSAWWTAQAAAPALKKIPLIVSFSPFMDETAALAHYILPNHIFLERYEDVPARPASPSRSSAWPTRW